MTYCWLQFYCSTEDASFISAIIFSTYDFHPVCGISSELVGLCRAHTSCAKVPSEAHFKCNWLCSIFPTQFNLTVFTQHQITKTVASQGFQYAGVSSKIQQMSAALIQIIIFSYGILVRNIAVLVSTNPEQEFCRFSNHYSICKHLPLLYTSSIKTIWHMNQCVTTRDTEGPLGLRLHQPQPTDTPNKLNI